MFPVDAFQKTLEKFTAIAELCQLRFHLTGGVTSVTWGEPRMTQDIDIVVDPERLTAVLSEFLEELRQSDFLHNPDAVNRAVRDGQQFQLLDEQELLKLDVYPRELIPGELTRSQNVEIFDNCRMPLVSLVDAAVSKLFWIDAGSHKSRQDVQAILRIADEAQRLEIHRLARELNLSHVLSSVTTE